MTKVDEYVRMIREQSITSTAAAKCSKEELEGKIITGVLYQSGDRPEFVDTMRRLGRARLHE